MFVCLCICTQTHYFTLSPFPSHTYIFHPQSSIIQEINLVGQHLKFILSPVTFFSVFSLDSGMLARLLHCYVGRVPSGVPDRTQWGTIEHARPPPRHTLCAPLALLERFSYANEKLPTSDTSLPTILPLFFPSLKTAPDLSLCPQLF